MRELPTHFVAQEPADSESSTENLLNPELVKARLRVQTIQRFQKLNNEIADIRDPKEQEVVCAKLDTLATQELGNVWEVLKRPEVDVILLMIGGKTKGELKRELRTSGYKINSYAEQMMDNPDFTTLSQPEPVELVRLTVHDLGFSDFATTDQLYAKAKELGLDLCPAEVGPWYRLHTPNQLLNEHVYVGMPPIVPPNLNPSVFDASHVRDGRWLAYGILEPTLKWFADNQFLFRIPASRVDRRKSPTDGNKPADNSDLSDSLVN